MKKIHILKQLLERYVSMMKDPWIPGNSIEIYENPTDDELENTVDKDTAARFLVDFKKKKVYAWKGSILHEKVKDQLGSKLSTLYLHGLSKEGDAKTLDAPYFLNHLRGGAAYARLSPSDIQTILKSDWKWLSKYFTNIDQARGLFEKTAIKVLKKAA